ncbi:MAG: alpha/beta fold hydrolase [Gammaproteobacteria bacterium]|nr:alpha/beta fold hydrolase [Gammaproteobacteria bacterium]
MTETDPEAEIGRLDALCEKAATLCGGGRMVWRIFGDSDRTLALFHGGSGSWWHWIRCIEPLRARGFKLLIPDLPGLGDSDNAPQPYDAAVFGAILADGIRRLTSPGNPPHLAGFSFGGVTGGHAAAALGHRARSMTIIGSGGMGLTRPPMAKLMRWRRLPTEEERKAAHQHNLMTLMLAHESTLDDLALYIQYHNTVRARTKSGPASRRATLQKVLPKATCKLAGIYGELDATAKGYLDERRAFFAEMQPGAPFDVISGSGHWVMYEGYEAFLTVLVRNLDRFDAIA